MPRNPSINQAQVSAIADAIQGVGLTPTARVIRDKLGAGSMGTVTRLLRSWQAGQASPAPVFALPMELQQGLLQWVAGSITQATAALEAQLSASQQSCEDLITESEQLSADLDERTTEVNNLSRANAELSGKLSLLMDQHSSLRHAANDDRFELAVMQDLVPKLEKENTRLQQALEQEREKRIEALQEAAAATARLEKMQSS